MDLNGPLFNFYRSTFTLVFPEWTLMDFNGPAPPLTKVPITVVSTEMLRITDNSDALQANCIGE